MPQKTSSLGKFWKELKRRKVVHVVTVYIAVAFGILQLVDIIVQPLHLPDWTTALAIVLLSIGFIIAVFLSWVYDITPSGVRKTKPTIALKHPVHTVTPKSNGWKIATYVSVAIILVLLAFNFISRRSIDSDISNLEKSIAVLPFYNDSSSDSTTYFINGLMDEILNSLQKIGSFSRVLPRTSTEQYRGLTRPPIPKIAKDLNVNFIVAGSGQKYGNSYSIRVQLLDGKNEKQLWVDSYKKDIESTNDIYGVQSETAQSIAAKLKTTITPEEKQLIEKVPTSNITALNFYQKAREEEKFSFYDLMASTTTYSYVLSDPSTKQSVTRAERLYKKALAYDSTFALAYCGLAGIYWSKNYYKEYFSENFLDSVRILADKALSFDDQLPDAYYIRGMYYGEKSNYKQALDNFDKTLRLNPNYWLAYYGKGVLYNNVDDGVNAIKNLLKVVPLNHGSGLSDVLRYICFLFYGFDFNELANKYNNDALNLESDSIKYFYWQYMLEGNSQKGLEFLKKGYRIDSTNNQILVGLAEYYEATGQFKEAIELHKKLFERYKLRGITIINNMQRFAYDYSKIGLKDSALYYLIKQKEYCNDAIKLGRPYGISFAYYDLAGVYAFMGNKIKAYENLKIFNQVKRSSHWMAGYIKTDPMFDSIRPEPEFQKIINDVDAKAKITYDELKDWLEEQGMLQ